MKYLIKADLCILFRIPISLFFNVFFPIFIATIMILTVGEIEIGSGFTFVDKYYLIGLTFGIAPLTLISLPISISEIFNNGILERLYLFNVDAKKVLFSQVIVHFINAIFEMVVITIYLNILFGLSFEYTEILQIFALYSLVSLAMISLGLLVGLILPNKETAQSVGLVIMFSFLMLIGGFGDTSNLPQILQDISSYIPLNLLSNEYLNAIINGSQIPNEAYIINILYVVICGFISFVIVKKKFKKL